MLILDTHSHVYSVDEANYPTIVKPLRPPGDTGSVANLERVLNPFRTPRKLLSLRRRWCLMAKLFCSILCAASHLAPRLKCSLKPEVLDWKLSLKSSFLPI